MLLKKKMGLTLGSMFSRPQKCAQSEKSAFFKIKKNLHFRSTPFLLVFCFKCDATCTRQKKKKKKKKWGEVVGPIFWTDDRFIVASLDNMVCVLSQSAESSTHGSSTQYRQWYNWSPRHADSRLKVITTGGFSATGWEPVWWLPFKLDLFFNHVLSPKTLPNACARWGVHARNTGPK